MLQKLAASLV